jgi:hypothetical protein
MYAQPSMHATKYQNTQYNYRDTFAFPSDTYLNTQRQRIFSPETVQEFDSFTLRENAVSLAFFANKHDPEMIRILSLLEPLATNVHKLIIIDVSELPELGKKYQVYQPTLMKLFKGHPLRFFQGEFTDECLKNFTQTISMPRWRQPDIR